MKQCTKCLRLIPLMDFHKRASAKDGLHPHCKECAKGSRRRYRAEHQDEVRDYQRAWLAANPDYHVIRNADPVNAAKRRETQRRWRADNRDLVNAYGQVHNQRRRARVSGASADKFTRAELLAYWDEQGMYSCVYCDGPFEHIDHIIPLSRGGQHALENLVPSCANDNLSKHDRTALEFMTARLTTAS